MNLKEKITSLIRPAIRELSAYHVPDARGLVKLDAMENPYALPEALKAEWLSVLKGVAVNRYPDPAANVLRRALRETLGVPASIEIMLGNGSDELIQIILMSVALPGAAVLAPTPTFVMYEMISRFVGMRFIGVPLTNGFELDGPAVQAAVANENPAVIFLAYPNNPTGNLFSREAVLSVIKTAPGLVVLDEAYHAFAQDSFMSELLRFDNLLVMRTLSKQGLAGLRLGALAGRPEWLKEFDKVRLPYNINSLTQASAEFALRHASALDAQATRLREAREALYASLKTMPELEAWPSRANFILFRVKSRSATEVFEALKVKGVLIKNLDHAGPALEGCLRVTVGKPDENTAFLEALKASL